MANASRFPEKIVDQSIYIKRAVTYLALPANKTRLKIDDTALAVVTDELPLFIANEGKYADPNLRTKTIVETNVTKIILLRNGLNDIYADIPNSTLTTDDRNMLLIFKRGTGSIIPAVDYAPVIEIDSVDFELIRLRFGNPNTPTSAAMPHGQSIFIESYKGVAGLAAADIPYTNGQNVSTAFVTILFDDTDLGKTFYVRCYYENTRHERGPKSMTITKVIA